MRSQCLLSALVRVYSSDRLFERYLQVAFLWLLGEYGEHVPRAPYVVEDYVQEFSDLEPNVQMQVRLEFCFFVPQTRHSDWVIASAIVFFSS